MKSENNEQSDGGQSLRDLATLDVEVGGGGDLLRTTLYALASPQSGTVGSEECDEFVAAQVYEEADDATPNQAEEYVRLASEILEIEDMSDVDALLGKQRHLEKNYEGQVGLARENHDQ